MLQQLVGIAVGFNQQVSGLRTEETAHPGDGCGIIHHHTGEVRSHVITQDAMDEILVPIQQNRWCGGLRRLLDRLPLTQQRLEIIN